MLINTRLEPKTVDANYLAVIGADKYARANFVLLIRCNNGENQEVSLLASMTRALMPRFANL